MPMQPNIRRRTLMREMRRSFLSTLSLPCLIRRCER
jgi:hypothetical protein